MKLTPQTRYLIVRALYDAADLWDGALDDLDPPCRDQELKNIADAKRLAREIDSNK
jgi:hypothetical protein